MPRAHPDRLLPIPPGSRSLRSRTAAALLVGAGLVACGKDTGPITDVRDRPAGIAPEMSAADRLRGDPHAQAGGLEPEAAASPFSWEAPSGWEALPPSPMRIAGFRVGGSPDAECSLATAGGALKDNVNRWRNQMSLEPVDDAAVAALPREPFLDREGVLVELAGTYKGMRGGKPVEGAKLLGLVAELPRTSLFVKMVGPAAVVDAEKDRFRAFARSIRLSMPAGHPATGETAPGPATAEGPLRWTAPAGWVEGPARPMRVVTLVPQGATRTECYVSVLSGAAGGTLANVNRWREQMGLAAVDAAAVAALPRIPALGTQGVLVELEGALDDPMRGVRIDDGVFYGLVVERASDTVFVKMTGPAAEMRPQRAAFEAFCRSLEATR